MARCKVQQFNADAPANQRCGRAAAAANHVAPQRAADAEEFGFEPLDVLTFARAVGVDYTTAILMMDTARSLSR